MAVAHTHQRFSQTGMCTDLPLLVYSSNAPGGPLPQNKLTPPAVLVTRGLTQVGECSVSDLSYQPRMQISRANSGMQFLMKSQYSVALT